LSKKSLTPPQDTPTKRKPHTRHSRASRSPWGLLTIEDAERLICGVGTGPSMNRKRPSGVLGQAINDIDIGASVHCWDALEFFESTDFDWWMRWLPALDIDLIREMAWRRFADRYRAEGYDCPFKGLMAQARRELRRLELGDRRTDRKARYKLDRLRLINCLERRLAA